ncbi:MAG TPA: transglutaminase family protein [Blastocatellia bacterium]|nr:transglutaminase family protein [Blastocatellia bacterium]
MKLPINVWITQSVFGYALCQMDYSEFTSATRTIESTHPAVVGFARLHAGEAATDIEQCVRLFYAVRDGIRYDPYRIDLTVTGMKASTTLEVEHGWCVSKAILLAASCRSLGIPARLGFADVRNHLSTERLRQRMRTDIFYWHGYTEMLLRAKWVKATPAFNIELCEKFDLLPLEFDGLSDSLYHPFDATGNRHMEYVNSRGTYSDLPLEDIIRTFRQEYSFGDRSPESNSAGFDNDVARETSR